MADLLEYEDLADNDTLIGLPIPLEQLVSTGSQPSSASWLSDSDGFDGKILYIVHHDSQGTSCWVDTMSPLSQAELEFQQQKEAFLAIPPLLLAQYQNQFVVSHNGEILDQDPDLPTLTGRFFAQHEDLSVYIAKVGDTIRATIDTPFFD
jgi:hypothetical protein